MIFHDYSYRTLDGVHQLDQRAYPYEVVIPALITPISLALLKSHLRITTTTDDALLTLIIEAVTKFAEDYTHRDFIVKGYRTFRDFFKSFFKIRRSKLQLVTEITYKKDSVDTVIPSTVYFSTVSNSFSDITLQLNQSWPSDIDAIVQSIKIEFTSGYGALETDVPPDLREALLNHAAQFYSDRGDCSDCSCESSLPANARAVYNQYRILNL